MYGDPTEYHRKIEPTQKAYSNPYEDTNPYYGFVPDIPPPPPKRRRTWLIVFLACILCVAAIGTGAFFVVTARAGSRHNVVTQATPLPKIAPPTSIPTVAPTPQPTILVETPTPNALPTSTPLPVISTAQDIYTQFTTAGIAMGNAGDVPHSWWLQCCSYYPGRGSISFIDELSSGEMTIALFTTANGVQTDVTQLDANSSHPGNYQLGTCLLLYWSANTNLTPYEQVMQQYCA